MTYKEKGKTVWETMSYMTQGSSKAGVVCSYACLLITFLKTSTLDLSMVVFTFSLLYVLSGNILLGKFGPKNQNVQFRQKCITKTNSSMQTSMLMFPFLVFKREYFFC